jgi:Spy/CpxP family protein refolding chaperone
MGQRHWMDMGARMSRHLERLAQQLNLSDAQRTQIQTLQLSYAREAIRARADLAVMHLDLRQLLQADQPDLTKVNDMLQQMANREMALRLARITMRQDIRTVLTPAQRQQWRALRVQRMRQGSRDQ